jgi:hypothetical protein
MAPQSNLREKKDYLWDFFDFISYPLVWNFYVSIRNFILFIFKFLSLKKERENHKK